MARTETTRKASARAPEHVTDPGTRDAFLYKHDAVLVAARRETPAVRPWATASEAVRFAVTVLGADVARDWFDARRRQYPAGRCGGVGAFYAACADEIGLGPVAGARLEESEEGDAAQADGEGGAA